MPKIGIWPVMDLRPNGGLFANTHRCPCSGYYQPSKLEVWWTKMLGDGLLLRCGCGGKYHTHGSAVQNPLHEVVATLVRNADERNNSA